LFKRIWLTLSNHQANGVAKNIELVLKGKEQIPVKPMAVEMFMCSIGRGRGAGRVGSVKVPSFLVWIVKGRTLGRERAHKYANGTMW
jgi:apoptosis-inducing factor 2